MEIYNISLGNESASISSLGAQLVSFEKNGLQVVEPFDPKIGSPAFNGAILAPWPNRIEDGKYSFGGKNYQLEINDKDRNNALHGLLFKYEFVPTVIEKERVVLEHISQPSDGYPWSIKYDIMYKLTHFGLKVVAKVWNMSDAEAPFGIGWHPWLATGGDLDSCKLYMKAGIHIVPNERLLPVDREPAEYPKGFNQKTSLLDLDLDDAFTDLHFKLDGNASAYFERADKHHADVWCNESMMSFHLCSADHISGFERKAMAIEPVSCEPNAFNTGKGLIALQPGIKKVFRFGIFPMAN